MLNAGTVAWFRAPVEFLIALARAQFHGGGEETAREF